MSTGQIKRYNTHWITGTFGSSRVDPVTEINGPFVKYVDHVQRVEDLETQVEFEMNEKAKARAQRSTCVQRVKELEHALLYYADEKHFKHGDVPGHIYALDDAGHTARTALGLNQSEVENRITSLYYTE